MAPGLTGIVGGRPTVWPKIRLYSCLVPKEMVSVSMDMGGEKMEVPVPTEGGFDTAQKKSEQAPLPRPEGQADTEVRLVDLAWGRSGDKGDHCNIGVVARRESYLPWIAAALTPERVAEWMGHTLDPEKVRYCGGICRGFMD